MKPTLFKIGFLSIQGYGLMVAIAFLVALQIAVRMAKREGLPPKLIYNLSIYILISAFLGARFFYILQHYDSYGSFISVFELWQGGLMYYGGFVTAFVITIMYLIWMKQPIGKVLDILGPPMLLGKSISRVGCFLAGCCFGKPTTLPWGVIFPEYSPAWMELGYQKVHPTQLYSVLSLFIIFMVLLILRRYMRFSGQLFLFSVIFYSMYRFLIDFLRYYKPNERIGVLATSQVVSLIFGSIALIFMIVIITRMVLPKKP